jgi:xanthine dehydrogenase YagR molybdenum-binding subunit
MAPTDTETQQKKDTENSAKQPTGTPPAPQAALPGQGQQPPNEPEKRSEQLPFGIAGVRLEQIERQVPVTDAPALPPNDKLSVLGKPTPRLDGRMKVTGAARYTADINLPGMLFARMLTATIPHGTIKSIDTSAAEGAPGVRAVHILDRDRGAARQQGEDRQKYPRVRYAGQPLGGIAADTQAHADEAARLVKIEYEPQPFVVDVEKAMQPDAPLIYTAPTEQAGTAGGGGGARGVQQKGNVRGPAPGGRNRENIEEAFKTADVIHEAEYRTQVQTHSPLETHGLVADFKPDQLTVWASTQGTSSVQDELASVFQLPKSKVRVITEYMGGGFGAKFGAGNYGVLATHLSKKAGAPVRLMLDRREQHLCVGNRPSSVQKIKVGATRDGKLVALQNKAYGTGGVATGAGATGPTQNLYACPTVLTEDNDVFINAGPATAMRAPGHPQGAFALEQAIDELADKLGMDPLVLRDKNDESEARRVERKIGAERIGWAERKPAGSDTGPIKRGIGMAQSVWYAISSRSANCEVRLTHDGSVQVMSSVQDIGGGIRTVLGQIVAETLGLKPSDIDVKIGDTQYPIGPNSGGSCTTNAISPVARNAAWSVRQQLLDHAAKLLGAKNADELDLADGKIFVKADNSKSLTLKQAASKLPNEQISATAGRGPDYVSAPRGTPRGSGMTGLGGVQFARVAVDTGTGRIYVERVVAVHDCGRPLNPLTVDSQVNGGVLQGISYALFENRILDRNTGVMVNPNLEEYKIVGSRETPQIESILIEQYWARSSTDATGIGEPAVVATAGAIANAVYNAIGVRVRELPMTPAAVLRALATKNA